MTWRAGIQQTSNATIVSNNDTSAKAGGSIGPIPDGRLAIEQVTASVAINPAQ